MKRLWATLMIAAVATASAARAEDQTVALRDVAVVQNGRDEARIYFRTALASLPSSVVIERAELTVPYAGSAEDRSLEVRVCPVTGSWTSGARWDTAFDEELYSRADLDLRSGSGALRFDVTVPLVAMHEHGLAADGFVLTIAGDRGLRAADLSRLSTFEGARLTLRTTALPSGRPPARWLERHGVN